MYPDDVCMYVCYVLGCEGCTVILTHMDTVFELATSYEMFQMNIHNLRHNIVCRYDSHPTLLIQSTVSIDYIVKCVLYIIFYVRQTQKCDAEFL